MLRSIAKESFHITNSGDNERVTRVESVDERA